MKLFGILARKYFWLNVMKRVFSNRVKIYNRKVLIITDHCEIIAD